MRTVSREGSKLVVSDDPDRTIATLLDSASSDKHCPADAFELDGDGYGAPDIVSASRVTSPDDIPLGWEEYIPNEPDVWVVLKDVHGSGMDVAWLRGNELRALMAETRRIKAVEEKGGA